MIRFLHQAALYQVENSPRRVSTRRCPVLWRGTLQAPLLVIETQRELGFHVPMGCTSCASSLGCALERDDVSFETSHTS